MPQAGAAVLEVQRLELSQGGLLNLRLFQKAGSVLLQSLKVQPSTEVCIAAPSVFRLSQCVLNDMSPCLHGKV